MNLTRAELSTIYYALEEKSRRYSILAGKETDPTTQQTYRQIAKECYSVAWKAHLELIATATN